MNPKFNPYTPPQSSYNDITYDMNSLAGRYRVIVSKTSVREFRNLSGKPVLGTLFWLALKMRLVNFSHQILDGPRPLAEEQCDPITLSEPIRKHLLAKSDAAEKLGFHSRVFSAYNSTGIEVQGGAVRMLHRSGDAFLSIFASSSMAIFQGYENVVSANSSSPMSVHLTTNGPPNYNPLKQTTIQRMIGQPLSVLFDAHTKSIAKIENLKRISTAAELETVVDYLSVLFYADKISRGIFVKVPNP